MITIVYLICVVALYLLTLAGTIFLLGMACGFYMTLTAKKYWGMK